MLNDGRPQDSSMSAVSYSASSYSCSYPSSKDKKSSQTMPVTSRPIKRVAVIGAGISGVCSAAHLLKFGLDVVLFERSSTAGGIWHCDENVAPDPPYPNIKPSLGDYKTLSSQQAWHLTPPKTPTHESESKVSRKDSDSDFIARSIQHAPPGPCYAGLKNNVPLRAMKTTLGNWPEGLPDHVSQRYIEEYVQQITRRHGVKL